MSLSKPNWDFAQEHFVQHHLCHLLTISGNYLLPLFTSHFFVLLSWSLEPSFSRDFLLSSRHHASFQISLLNAPLFCPHFQLWSSFASLSEGRSAACCKDSFHPQFSHFHCCAQSAVQAQEIDACHSPWNLVGKEPSARLSPQKYIAEV